MSAEAVPPQPIDEIIQRCLNGDQDAWDTIVGTHDLAERQKAYREVETIHNEMAWMIWLPVRVQKIPVSNRFGNMQPSVLRHRILWNAYNIYVK